MDAACRAHPALARALAFVRAAGRAWRRRPRRRVPTDRPTPRPAMGPAAGRRERSSADGRRPESRRGYRSSRSHGLPARGSRATAAGNCRSRNAAYSATDGAPNSVTTKIVSPSSVCIWLTKRAACSEVPPSSKKRSCDADPVEVEDPAPLLGDEALQRRAWRHEGRLELRPGADRGRQGLAVDLAVGVEREALERDDDGRDHVLGERLARWARSVVDGEVVRRLDGRRRRRARGRRPSAHGRRRRPRAPRRSPRAPPRSRRARPGSRGS